MRAFIILFFLLPLTVRSQPDLKKIRFGVTGGLNWTAVSYPIDFDIAPVSFGFGTVSDYAKVTESNDQLGAQIHGLAAYAISQRSELEVRLGLLYSRLNGLRNESYSTSATSVNNTEGLKQRSIWLEMPVLYRLNFFDQNAVGLEVGTIIPLPIHLNGDFYQQDRHGAFRSGKLQGDFRPQLYAGFRIRFLRQNQLSFSWSRLHAKDRNSNEPLFQMNSWRLGLGRYFNPARSG